MPTRKLHDYENDIVIGAEIRKLRKQQRRSQTDVATALGMTYQQLQKYENGTNSLTISGARKLAKELGVSPCALMGCEHEEAEHVHDMAHDEAVG